VLVIVEEIWRLEAGSAQSSWWGFVPPYTLVEKKRQAVGAKMVRTFVRKLTGQIADQKSGDIYGFKSISVIC